MDGRRVGQVVRRHIHRLNRRYGAGVSIGDALQHRQLGAHRRLVTDPRGHLSQKFWANWTVVPELGPLNLESQQENNIMVSDGRSTSRQGDSEIASRLAAISALSHPRDFLVDPCVTGTVAPVSLGRGHDELRFSRLVSQIRLSNEEAAKLYIKLCEGDVSGVHPHSAVDAFYTKLTALHPEIDAVAEREIDDHDYCPWSCALDRSSEGTSYACVRKEKEKRFRNHHVTTSSIWVKRS